MGDWAEGYVTDTSYVPGFYREMAPSFLHFVALAAGLRTPEAGAPIAYCELGCGHGYSANLIAAANPHIAVHANDFNPSHVAAARQLAAEAGTTNIRFSDASFADYADDVDLPGFDLIVLHGVYSWVSAENRGHVVDFIRRKLKVGGFVYVSYNAQPGWSSAAPLRRLLFEHGASAGGSTTQRLGPALEFADTLRSLGARWFRENQPAAERLDRLKSMDRRYLAHEYMNDEWRAFHSADVMAEMARAKLTFVTGAHLPERLHNISFTPGQFAFIQSLGSPALKETARDYILNQMFRRDLFAKGTVPLARGDLDTAWLDLRLALTATRAPDDLTVKAALGDVVLHAEVYEPILRGLAQGPCSVRDLLADPAVAATAGPALREAIILLVGYNRISPALDAAGEARRAARTAAFNDAVLRRALSGSELAALASPVTGSGITCGWFEMLLLNASVGPDADPIAGAERLLAASGEHLIRDGAPLTDPADIRAELADQYARLAQKESLLRNLGIVAAARA